MSATAPDLRGKLEQVNDEIASLTTEAQQKWAAFEQARDEFAKKGGEVNRPDSDEFKQAEDIHKEYAEKSEELAEKQRVRDGIFAMLGSGPAPAVTQPHDSQGKQASGVILPEGKSLADRVADSPEYKSLLESGALNSDHRGFTAKLADMTLGEVKALITGASDTSGGAFVDADRVGYVAQPRRRRSVLDLITTGSTSSDVVTFARQTAYTNAAAEVAEATASDTGTKPEATIAFENVTAPVSTIAHWVPATRQALSDVMQLRTLIESQLRYGLEYRLEAQVVNGNGSAPNLRGILQTSNILTQAKSTDSVTDAIHKAITQIRLAFIEPNGVALHPTDWQLVRLSRDGGGSVAGTGAYLFGPPSQAGEETIWGLPVAVSAAVPDDTGIVADFRQCVLWLREGAQVLVSDSHDDFFVKNLVVLLAEMRAAFGVLNANAVCKVTGLD
jgi:HK97 family phage major capsid protein